MAISKSTPYVRYKENFTSNLHLGTIHVESEYLDRTQKTTIESIHGMTWHNKVVNENKELDLLSNLGFELTESKREYFNVGEQRVSVDEIHGMQDIEPNEDGAYTYSVTSIEGEYAEIYDGLNHITSTSDGLDGNFEIVYDTDEEDITGSVVLDATMPNYTIEDSNIGELNDVVFKGETLINILPQPSLRNKMENISTQRLNEGHDEVVVADGAYKSAILTGQTLVNLALYKDIICVGNVQNALTETILKGNTQYILMFTHNGDGERFVAQEYVSNAGWIRNHNIQLLSSTPYQYYIFTTSETCGLLKIQNTTTNTYTLDNLMLIEYQEGMETWDIPYFTGMQSVKMPVLTTTGKNLFDETYYDGWLDSTTGNFVESPNGTRKATDFIEVIGGETYTISGCTMTGLRWYDINKKPIDTNWNHLMTTITAPTNAKYLRFTINSEVDYNNVQIEKGSIATSYEPFKSNILTCNEPIELGKVGNVEDELNLLTGEVVESTEELIITGNENFVSGSNATDNTLRLQLSFPNSIPSSPLICDKFKVVSSTNNLDEQCISIQANFLLVRILKSNLGGDETVQGCINYIKNNNFKIRYIKSEKVVKTVVLTATDQDNVVLETGKPISYKDGHIQVQSSGVLPSSISYEVPSQNHIHVDMLKPSNTYTLKRNGENFEGSFFIDGTEYNTNVFMTNHQLPNKSLIINDMSEHDKVAMFEGNYGTSTIPYFEGMQSVKMPILTTTGKNLFDINKFKSIGIDEQGYYIPLKFVDNSAAKATLKLKPNTKYVVTGTYIYTGKARFTFKINDGAYQNMNNAFETDATGVVNIKIGSNNVDVSDTSKMEKIMIVESTLKDIYEPYKSNILTCNEEVELRGIGDVKDEYKVETGELTQRIGEAIYTEKESWYQYLANDFDNSCLFSCTSLKIGDTSDSSMKTNFISDRFTPSTQIFMNDIIGSYIQGGSLFIRVKKEWLSTPNVYGLQKYLQSNPITVQYQLAQPITRKVISTILDQDGRQIRSIHTYTGLTNLSTSSDTLIPNVNLDYEISSSTGTVIGTSATIENGENGSPISAIVYGESLVNNIQEPSDVECVVLGEHIGSNITIENSVEGNIENVILKGTTLVNLGGTYNRTDAPTWFTVFVTQQEVKQGNVYYAIINNTGDGLMRLRYSTSDAVIKTVNPMSCEKFTFTATESDYLRIKNSDTISNCNGTFLLLEYQEGMENWDIPYFEGMGSVEMPTLTTTGKNLIDASHTLSLTREQNPTVNSQDVSRTEFTDVTLNSFTSTTASSGYWQYACYRISNAKPNTTYTLSYLKNIINPPEGGSSRNHRLIMFTSKKGSTSSSSSNERSVHKITTENDGVLFLCLADESQNGGGVGAKTQFRDIQLEEGSVSTPYEPYQSNTLTINEPIELRAIGDVKDELNLITGELNQYVGQTIYTDGSAFYVNNTYNVTEEKTIGFRTHTAIQDIKHAHGGAIVFSSLSGSVGANKDNPGVSYQWHSLIIRVNKEDLPTLDIAGLDTYLKEHPLVVQYELATPITKTISTTILDQDGNPTSLHSYNDTTHIATNSQGLTANVEISNPSYDVVLKANTKYTLKLNRTNAPTNTPLEINLGGTEATMDSTVNSIAITMPSTLANNKLTISGVGNKFKEAMVIEGDCVDRDLDYFEGIVGVENPILATTGKNLFDASKWITGRPSPYSDSSMNQIENTQNSATPIIKCKPNTTYTVSRKLPDNSTSNWYAIYGYNKEGIKVQDIVDTQYIGNNTFTTNNDVCYLRGKSNNPYEIGKNELWQIEEGSTATPYEPYQGNTLATYPQVTLRSIGDIKDELDLVNGTVTRRIGEIIFDGTLDGNYDVTSVNTELNIFTIRLPRINDIIDTGNDIYGLLSDKYISVTSKQPNNITCYSGRIRIVKSASELELYNSPEKIKAYLQQNPFTVQYPLAEPVTESVYITPPNPRTSTASVTLSTQLGESDYVTWNPYKEHYVHYNYEQDGSYTWDNLTDLNERQFIELYDRRTYVEQEYKNTFLSHDSKGTSKYVLIEPNQDYTVTVRFSELPQCETVKVNLGGSEVEMNVSDPHVHVTTPNTLSNYLCSISGKGLSGKITDILVIHCLEHEGFADIDYFEGIDSIGEVVEVDGVPKSKIVIEQTNGNLLDFEPVVFNNGNYISMAWNENNRNIPLKPNTSYRLKTRKSKNITTNNGWGDVGARLYTSEMVNTRSIGIDSEFTTRNNEKYLRFYKQQSHNGNANIHEPLELTYAHFTDNELIRPRYYDKQEIILPMQLCRINTVYDNFYYDVIRGHYRIQQSIGHKYFTGADNENWTLIERGQRILRFRYNNADIQIKSLGEYMTNRFTNDTTTSPYESCAFNGSTFIISIDKERLSNATLVAFKEWLSSHNVHLYYQLASPMMIDLPQYSSKLELNTYKDEIYTFLKNCKPTVFTLDVPLDQTYRFYELQESQGYTNRIELTDERMTEEDALYINTIYGSGISNLIEEPNNVNTLLKPNYEGRATSHTLTNGKVSTISVHGFEPNGVKVGAYNTVTKQYELTVKTTSGANNNSVVFPIPYALEQYEDGTHDMVYYNSEYKQWMFEGGQTITVAYNSSTGVFTNAIEIFRGMTPRSGMIGEFKVKFASGTTSARLYYSLDGSTYTYTTLRSMTDGVEYYIAFFNTGGTKIDMGTKIGADSEYTTLVPLSGTMTEALMINQIQSITECTYYLDKTYYYTEPTRPIELTVYEGTNTITENNGAIITIENNAHNKDALIYANTPYTVYWTHVGGQGNIKVTLGGVTQEVAATQGYVTITTSDADLERGLLIGGFDVTIKDLMLVKGERIADLSYFEGSRAVGTAFIDEDGNTMYRVTLVTGSELIQDKFEDVITFEDNKKHNVLVTKLLGTKPNKN